MQLLQFSLLQMEIENNVFYSVTGFKISNTDIVNVKNGYVASNHIVKDNFFYIDSTQQLIIDNFTFNANIIPSSS